MLRVVLVDRAGALAEPVERTTVTEPWEHIFVVDRDSVGLASVLCYRGEDWRTLPDSEISRTEGAGRPRKGSKVRFAIHPYDFDSLNLSGSLPESARVAVSQAMRQALVDWAKGEPGDG